MIRVSVLLVAVGKTALDAMYAVFDGAFCTRHKVDDPANRGVYADDGEREDDKDYPSCSVSEMNERLFHMQPLG